MMNAKLVGAAVVGFLLFGGLAVGSADAQLVSPFARDATGLNPAETEAMPITVMAEAENQAANNKAEAITMLAKADADAAITRAAGVKSLGQAEAEVAALKAEARNKLSAEMVDYDLTLARINVIPNALAEAVKPIEKMSAGSTRERTSCPIAVTPS